ncbi:MAG: nucleotidyltransferase family protein, partial [Clostridia bacterium]|nr:nucleotidyltransferase family protein [Clostridia bacterium]
PNNILAVEYLKALKDTQSSITPHTMPRIGGGYLQTNVTDYPSASCVREQWQSGNLSSISQGVPAIVLDYLNNTSPNTMQSAKDRLLSILKFNIDSMNLPSIHGVKEGVENRIKTTLKESVNWQDFVDKLSTKRYTNAYFLRTVINILLSNTYQAQNLQNDKIDFVNVLAVQEKSKDLLSAFNCDVITKSAEPPDNCLIRQADSLYSSVTKKIPNRMQIVSK